MKLLHDFNYEELHECLIDLYRDVQIYSYLVDGLNHVSLHPGLACMVNELDESFKDHIRDFDVTFDRIRRGVVPEEEKEPSCLLLKRKNI